MLAYQNFLVLMTHVLYTNPKSSFHWAFINQGSPLLLIDVSIGPWCHTKSYPLETGGDVEDLQPRAQDTSYLYLLSL